MRPTEGAVWITGASSGIGRELALQMVVRGYRIVASARSADKLESLKAECAAPDRLHPLPLDVADADACAAAIADYEVAHGPLAGAVLNAGTHRPTDAGAMKVDDFRALFETNVMGTINGLAAVLPGLVRRRGGTVAIVASVAGYGGLPTAGGYGATKAALINLAESMKLELDGHGIRTVLVCPGFVKTPLTDRNEFPMPFLMPVEEAARRLLAGLEGTGFEVIFPRRFAWILKVLNMLPYPLYFALVRRATGA